MSQEAGAHDALDRQDAQTIRSIFFADCHGGDGDARQFAWQRLGLIRLQVINATFGQSAATGAFFAALKTPQQLSDLMIGGAVGAALIPFLDVRAEESRQSRAEFAQLFAQLTALLAAVMILAMLLLWLVAPIIVPRINAGFSSTDQQLTVTLVMILAPILVAQGLLAVAGSALYALQRPFWPAITAGAVHAGAIAGALILGPRWAYGVGIGVTAGNFGQLALLFPVLRAQDIRGPWQHHSRHSPGGRQVPAI